MSTFLSKELFTGSPVAANQRYWTVLYGAVLGGTLQDKARAISRGNCEEAQIVMHTAWDHG